MIIIDVETREVLVCWKCGETNVSEKKDES